MASKSQQYINNLSSEKKSVISIIVEKCKENGITSPIFQSALCAIVSKESDFKPKVESSYSNTSANNIRKIFGSRFDNYTDEQIDTIKQNDVEFFSIVYGNMNDNGPPSTKDGWKYRGRGFNQLTFKSNYRLIGKMIGLNLVDNPELMEKTDVAAKALIAYYINVFDKFPSSGLSQFGVVKQSDPIKTMNSLPDLATAVRVLYQCTAGVYKKRNGLPIALYYEKDAYMGGDGDIVFPNDDLGGFTKARNRAKHFYKMITGMNAPQDDNKNNDIKNEQQTEDEYQEDKQVSIVDDDNNKDNSDLEITTPGLTNILKPKIRVEPIHFNVSSESENYKKEIVSNLGWFPFVWYKNYQIVEKDIYYLCIYNDGFIPKLKMIFKDTMGYMLDNDFPLDDSKIKIFLSSRTLNIRHILLEFKITNFSVYGDRYSIIGTLNVNGLYIKQYMSYRNMSSFDVLKNICNDIGLGFNSNISSTNDKMNWINPGKTNIEFIRDVLTHSYISDNTFVYGYIDYYYNFNFVDIEKELRRDISGDHGVDTSGLTSNITGDDERIYRIELTNDKSHVESDRYISNIKYINNSTSVSLKSGYVNLAKYYNTTKKELLFFGIDSITNDDDTKIELKGSDDEYFYNNNRKSIYLGKMDTDNVHINYLYSEIHNIKNIDELRKVGIRVILPNPNYNLYKFQKVRLIISGDIDTPMSDMINKRLSGEWLITDIKIIYKNSNIYQDITLVKRELENPKDNPKLSAV